MTYSVIEYNNLGSLSKNHQKADLKYDISNINSLLRSTI